MSLVGKSIKQVDEVEKEILQLNSTLDTNRNNGKILEIKKKLDPVKEMFKETFDLVQILKQRADETEPHKRVYGSKMIAIINQLHNRLHSLQPKLKQLQTGIDSNLNDIAISNVLNSLNLTYPGNIDENDARLLADALIKNDAIGKFGGIPILRLKSNDPSLTALSLSNYGCSHTEAFVLASLLKINSTLKKISLRGNSIGDYGAKALANGLQFNETLIELDLNGNNIENAGAEALANVLTLCIVPNEDILSTHLLETADPNKNKKDDLPNLKTARIETKVYPGLKVIDLRNNFSISGKIAIKLAKSIMQNKTIEIFSGMSILKMKKNDTGSKLCLANFGCSDTEAIVLGYILEVNTVLQSIDMSYNPGIGITGAKHLANAIVKHKRINIFGCVPVYNLITNDPKLKELVLVGNGCGITEAILVGLLLNNNSTISKVNINGEIMLGAFHNDRTKNLNLCMKGYKDIDAIIIAALLKGNSTITKLFLVGNNIGNIGAQAIAEELSVNHTLKELYMSCNQIGDLGAKAIGEALKTNKALNKLWLFSNEITDSGANALVEGLEKNKTLQKIYLSQNKFSRKGKRKLRNIDNLSTRSIIV